MRKLMVVRSAVETLALVKRLTRPMVMSRRGWRGGRLLCNRGGRLKPAFMEEEALPARAEVLFAKGRRRR